MAKNSQKSVIFKVEKFIKDNNLIGVHDEVIVALSGGPDSVCLFDILFKLKEKLNFKLTACHYNHRMRGDDSYNDEVFVRKICQDRGVECMFGEAQNKNQFKNEEEARDARYAFFEKISGERRGAKIAIAHNSNDLSETLLMRLFRGTGLKGLSGIPSVRKKFIRPLLPVTRDEIISYLEAENINFRTDKTNSDPKITRNYIRLKILPMLTRDINPKIIETISSFANIAEEDYQFLEEEARKEFKKILIDENKDEVILDRKKWIVLHPSLQRMALRLGIEKLTGLTDITNKQIQEVREVILKGEGKKYKILPHSLRVELASGKIVISARKTKVK